MTARIIDMRLRKIEKQVGASALSRLSNEALNARLHSAIDEVCRPWNGNIQAAADGMRNAGSLEDREVARGLDWLIANFDEVYPAPKAG